MASHEENTDSWVRGNYCVRKLPSTLDMLKWDYGALSPKDETMYIISKMEYLHGRSIKVSIRYACILLFINTLVSA